jgi:hypothetical protein
MTRYVVHQDVPCTKCQRDLDEISYSPCCFEICRTILFNEYLSIEFKYYSLFIIRVKRWRSWWSTAYESGSRGFDFRWCNWNFIDIILPAALWAWILLCINRNEYQGYVRGVKFAGAWGWWLYHLHVPIFCKSGNLELLEPSRPVRACTRIVYLSFIILVNIQITIGNIIWNISVYNIVSNVFGRSI